MKSATGPAWLGLLSAVTGCLPLKFDRLKKPRWFDDDLSLLEDCPGGGGKLGDIGTCGELRVELSATTGDDVKPLLSSSGEAPAGASVCASMDPALYGGGGEGIAASVGGQLTQKGTRLLILATEHVLRSDT